MSTEAEDKLRENAKRIQNDLAEVMQEALHGDAELAEVLLACVFLVSNVALHCKGAHDTDAYVAKETARLVRRTILGLTK